MAMAVPVVKETFMNIWKCLFYHAYFIISTNAVN